MWHRSSQESLSRGTTVAGTPAIAAPGASYAIDFSWPLESAELLLPAAADRAAGKIDEASRRRESGTKTTTCPRNRGSSREADSLGSDCLPGPPRAFSPGVRPRECGWGKTRQNASAHRLERCS